MARPSRQRFRAFVAAGVALVTAGIIGGPGATPAKAAPRDDAADTRYTLRLPTSGAAPQRPVSVRPSAVTGPDCSKALAHPRTAAGAKAVSCSSVTALQSGNASVKKAAVPATLWCRDLRAKTWWFTRTEACVHGSALTYTMEELPSRRVIGTANFVVTHDIDTNASNNADIFENATVEMVAATGAATSVQVRFTASCGTPCVTHDGDGFNTRMQVGSVQEGLFSYTDNPRSTAPDSFPTQYKLEVLGGPTVSQAAATWSMPTDIRCDNQVGGKPGCVIPYFRPDLELSLSTYRAAAVNIIFAQQYLPDRWGLSSPLSRQANTAKADANRRAICADGTFEPQPDVPSDSCDEFAFAASRQSGADFGLTGWDCAEIVPVEVTPGQWSADAISYNGNERCLRGHVPLAENTAVGGELGRFVQKERVLDEELYTVTVVA